MKTNKIFVLIAIITVLLFSGCQKKEIKLLNAESDINYVIIPKGYISLSIYGKDGETIIFNVCANSDYKKNISVAGLTKDICRELNIPFVFSGTGITTYVQGINGLFEFDNGAESGWLYSVNGEYQGIGCDNYILKDGDSVEWHYTLDLGKDLGAFVVDE